MPPNLKSVTHKYADSIYSKVYKTGIDIPLSNFNNFIEGNIIISTSIHAAYNQSLSKNNIKKPVPLLTWVAEYDRLKFEDMLYYKKKNIKPDYKYYGFMVNKTNDLEYAVISESHFLNGITIEYKHIFCIEDITAFELEMSYPLTDFIKGIKIYNYVINHLKIKNTLKK